MKRVDCGRREGEERRQQASLPRLVVLISITLSGSISEAKGILQALKESGIDLVIASRSPTSHIARKFLEKLGVRSMFVAEVSRMGVTSVLVGNGITLGEMRQGLLLLGYAGRSSSSARRNLD
ncbi:PREDICTED: uncharacterized protein LOC104824951 [Tarenaya hassleriana]|uniref:uncharacterized protein LOC104824951 n=1 Tax=Tarenaya hassleriana TaxID=28532 RepID=UPI00053C3CA2|nr:PREDICTED: uncharacterized protein LOC104824951 [Tarenaya hassleriana]